MTNTTGAKKATKRVVGLYAVDAGNIAVVSGDRAVPRLDCQTVVKLPPGAYDVTITLSAWNGKATKTGRMNLPTGEAIIGDACYAEYSQGWDKVLDETAYLDGTQDWLLACDTGGDGEFRAVVQFFKVVDGEGKQMTTNTKPAKLPWPKTLKALLNDPRVTDWSDERGSEDGIWIYLVAGYDNGDPETHAVHEDTVAEVLEAFRRIRPCSCEDCVREAKGSEGMSLKQKREAKAAATEVK